MIKITLILVYTLFLTLLMNHYNELMALAIIVSFLALLHWAEEIEQT